MGAGHDMNVASFSLMCYCVVVSVTLVGETIHLSLVFCQRRSRGNGEFGMETGGDLVV